MMATVDQVERGILAAERVGDIEAVKLLASELRALRSQPQPQGPGVPKSFARGLVGGTFGIQDLVTNVIAYPYNKGAELLGVEKPYPQKSAFAPMLNKQFDLPPPVTPGERAAELAGASLMPGGAHVGVAKAAGRAIPALATELGSLGGAVAGREIGVQAAGSGSISETVGTILGGMAPLGAGGVSRQISAPHVPFRSKAQQRDTLSAFERQGVPATVADVADTGYLQKAVGAIPGGHGVEKAVRQEQAGALQDAVNRLADQVSDIDAGQGIQKGIKSYVDDTFKVTANKLSKKLDSKVPKDRMVETPKTLALYAKLDAEKGPFKQSLGVPALKTMRKELADIGKPNPYDPLKAARGEPQGVRELTFKQLREARTAIGHRLTSGDLVSEIPRVDLKRLYGAMSEDIKVAAQAAGPDAERSLRRLNEYWGKGIKRVDDFLEPLSKKLTPEDAYRAVSKSTRDSPTRIAHLSKALTREQKEALIDATLRKAGTPVDSVASPTYTFSPETFLTKLNKIDDRSFALLARGTKYQDSLDLKDIKAVAGRLREVDKILKNPSGTADRLTAIAGTTALLTSPFSTFSSTALVGLLSAVGGSWSVSKLMTNQSFVKWFVEGNKLGPQQYTSHIARLPIVLEDEDQDTKEAAAKFIQSIQEQE